MKISTPIYEKLPLIYFTLAGALFFRFDAIGYLLPAVALFAYGAHISVLRSNYRRQNRVKQTVPGFRLPQVVYEYYPWGFVAFSMLLIKFKTDALGVFIALPFLLFALKVIYVRRQSRRVNLLSFGSKTSV
ncbi:hypothetical protein QWY77_09135 [Thalassotalea ponticola]|uniref:hypothetical protein n=1 Tax=Thalassotalea ponticola TaxID=1523392 RepID=UPI0025B3A2A9|nr:hypothetical protein [Thalassotalea ponticola]MDN3652921.1 hypothetical protein [Thalassotalea ponticola]